MRAGEHSLELQRRDRLVELLEVLPDLAGRVLVALVTGELVEESGLLLARRRAVELL